MEKPRSFTGIAARQLLRRGVTATLATINRADGIPYASLVKVATDLDGAPIILVSDLAWHTQNLKSDARASLLFAEIPPAGDALTGARVTVLGRLARVSGDQIRNRFLARHPEARPYAGFADFSFWRLEPGLFHAVAGFGRIETLPVDEVLAPDAGPAAWINEQMTRMLPVGAVWQVAAVDCDGADLVAGGRCKRVAFPAPIAATPDQEAAAALISAAIILP